MPMIPSTCIYDRENKIYLHIDRVKMTPSTCVYDRGNKRRLSLVRWCGNL